MNISEFSKYSWFADLAYVEWNDDNRVAYDAVKASVADKRAPQVLAEKIFLETKENYSVLSYHPNDETGFKASLYGNGSEKVLSICGTEPEWIVNSEDLLDADFQDIPEFGVAINQAVSMYNYIVRLITDQGTSVQQLSWERHYITAGESLPSDPNYIIDSYDELGGTYYYTLEAGAPAEGLGELLSAGETITLTGHSLGGHLAALAQRLFPDLFDQTVTFNAPGFDPVSANGGL